MPSRSHTSLSTAPRRPTTFMWVRLPLISKPVPKMIVSVGRSTPCASTTLCGRTSAIGIGDDVDVVARQRWIEVVGEQDALAADLVVGLELGPQLWVGDLLVQHDAGRCFSRSFIAFGVSAKPAPRASRAAVDRGAHRALAQGMAGVGGLLGRADRAGWVSG